ncbi:hypothetical protein [Methylobacterium sp. NEAU K]|uniref:hypothetical protein n=1 Tax=Methylobacterium sp. NEAU K TaxID=3064946 RepID=UPI0027361B58|nr:hypothetical protein [Methylobacterium sp. NEAU K]MDP4005342.1 hypothetical protein [Methylobacterium sp. NEAU K]
MTAAGEQPNKLAEVAGLAAAIADSIIDHQVSGTMIPPEQFRMLVSAARILQDNGVPWPPSVEHVVLAVAKRVEQAEAATADGETGSEADETVGKPTHTLNTEKRS